MSALQHFWYIHSFTNLFTHVYGFRILNTTLAYRRKMIFFLVPCVLWKTFRGVSYCSNFSLSAEFFSESKNVSLLFAATRRTKEGKKWQEEKSNRHRIVSMWLCWRKERETIVHMWYFNGWISKPAAWSSVQRNTYTAMHKRNVLCNLLPKLVYSVWTRKTLQSTCVRIEVLSKYKLETWKLLEAGLNSTTFGFEKDAHEVDAHTWMPPGLILRSHIGHVTHFSSRCEKLKKISYVFGTVFR